MKFEDVKLETVGYSMYYGDFQALRDVDIQIPRNRITAVIGPSGCGKSTFLRTFNRMNDLISGVSVEGDVTIDDQNVFKMDPVELRHCVGMVFQRPNPFPSPSLTTLRMAPAPMGRGIALSWPRSWNEACATRRSGMR
jgi:phosphate transport system ATP-binding protein